MFDQTTAMGDGSHRCGPNPLCPDRMEGKCRADLGSRSPVQSSTDTPGTSASTPTSSSEDGHDKLLGVDPDYCRRILVRGEWTLFVSSEPPQKYQPGTGFYLYFTTNLSAIISQTPILLIQ